MGERDELAEALDNVRTAIGDGEVPAVDASLPIVMAEYDRRGEQIARLEADNAKYAADYLRLGAVIGEQRTVEQAATALVEALHHTPYVAHRGEAPFRAFAVGDCVKCSLLDALAAAVHGESDGRV